MNNNGFVYENHIISNLKQLGLNGNITEGAGSSAADYDADIRINNQIWGIEIKLNSNAQMGGTSVRYLDYGNSVNCVSDLSGQISSVLRKEVLGRRRPLNELLRFLSHCEGREITGFPVSCQKDSWEKAAANNLLVNKKIRHSIDFIYEHYNKKGIDYIQIGKAGLFYLKNNPANLPIPQLQGNIDIEIRTGRSGSRKLACGKKVVNGGIRAQARLKTKNKSPIDLGDLKSVIEMVD